MAEAAEAAEKARVAEAAETEVTEVEKVSDGTETEKVTDKQTEPLDDPFHGISDSDIARYSDQFDVPPPENDADASRLAERIRRWIIDGRPDPEDDGEEDSDGDRTNEIKEEDKPENKNDKPAKKRGMFGFLRRGKRK